MSQRSIVVSCFAGWHGFDLAQGLDQHGLLQYVVTLASPRQIESRYGIPRERIRRMPLAPVLHRLELWLTKFAGTRVKDLYFNIFCSLYDAFTEIWLTPQTRMLVAWHPFASRALLAAQRRGIVTVLDVGSTHPLEQYTLLYREHLALGLPKPWIPNRVLQHCSLFHHVDWIAIPSSAVYNSFVNQGIPAEKLLLNPYGIESSLFKPVVPPLQHGPFTKEHQLKVLVVAGLTPRKGSRFLLEICHHLLSDPRIYFTLVGTLDPPYCFRPSELPSNLVIQTPRTHDALVNLYQQHHVCLLPSVEEGFGRVLIEAAGCGLTLLATSSTCIVDLLRHSPDFGYLLPHHNIADALQLLKNLIEAQLPLCHPEPQLLDYYTRAAYGRRAVKLLEPRLLAKS